jgi:AcrR family transcriptional regulator
MFEIEAAARTVFARNGFHDASISEIAQLAGIVDGAIYKYYEGKRELLLIILRHWILEMIERMRGKLDGVTGTRARLNALIWQQLKIIHENPDLCRLHFAEVRDQPDYHGSELYKLEKNVTAILLGVLNEGISNGDLRSEVPIRIIQDAIFGGIQHNVAAFLAVRGRLDCNAVAASLTSLVFDGAGKPNLDAEAASTIVGRLERTVQRLESVLKKRT